METSDLYYAAGLFDGEGSVIAFTTQGLPQSLLKLRPGRGTKWNGTDLRLAIELTEQIQALNQGGDDSGIRFY